jgi:ABC-type glycerol-3-phosphate transport system substrate-binding protein
MFKKLATVALVAAIICAAAIAGEVYDRARVTTATSGGTATWTNAVQDANLKLVRISVPSWAAIDTVTVTRVTGDSTATLTNELVKVVCTTSGGASNLVDQSNSMPLYMKAGDKLTFSSHVSTGGTIWVEYLQQRH